jgi:transcriptional regulator with XRE-family HTH domain
VLAYNVRERRKVLERTQEACAERAGLDTRTWRKIEGSDLGATLQLVADVAKALEIDPLDLFKA